MRALEKEQAPVLESQPVEEVKVQKRKVQGMVLELERELEPQLAVELQRVEELKQM